MGEEKEKVIYTGSIPQCPNCKKPTERTGGGGTTTAMYFPPIYDVNGMNTNPDKNIRTKEWECLECKKGYVTFGNSYDGYFYK